MWVVKTSVPSGTSDRWWMKSRRPEVELESSAPSCMNGCEKVRMSSVTVFAVFHHPLRALMCPRTRTAHARTHARTHATRTHTAWLKRRGRPNFLHELL